MKIDTANAFQFPSMKLSWNSMMQTLYNRNKQTFWQIWSMWLDLLHLEWKKTLSKKTLGSAKRQNGNNYRRFHSPSWNRCFIHCEDTCKFPNTSSILQGNIQQSPMDWENQPNVGLPINWNVQDQSFNWILATFNYNMAINSTIN